MNSTFTQPVNLGNPIERTIDGNFYTANRSEPLNHVILCVEFAQIIRSVVNGDSPVKYLPAVEDDPQKRKPDISRAKKYLNWEPRVFVSFDCAITF